MKNRKFEKKKKKLWLHFFKSRCSYAERMESHGQKRLDNKRGGYIKKQKKKKNEINVYKHPPLSNVGCFRRFHNHQTWDSFRWRSVASRKPLASIWASRSLSSSRYLQWGEPDNKRERGCFRLIVSDKSKLSLTAYSFKALKGKWSKHISLSLNLITKNKTNN